MIALLERDGLTVRGEPVNYDNLVVSINAMRLRQQKQIGDSVYNAGSASQYTSNALMRAHRFKHIRLKENPDVKYAEPVTVQQSVRPPFCFQASAPWRPFMISSLFGLL